MKNAMRMPLAAALSLALAGTGGCATKGPVSQPPVLALPAESACTAAPDLGRALPLVFDADKDTPLDVQIGPGSACLERSPGEKSLYGVVSLPTAGEQLIVSVASEPLGQSIFAPQLLLLDGTGKLLREVSRDDFAFRGGALTALIRAHENERYLVILSDPKMVGQNVSRIAGAVNVQTVSTGVVMFNMYSGSESTSSLTYSHGGTVKVAARALSPK